jgi:signal peptidase I
LSPQDFVPWSRGAPADRDSREGETDPAPDGSASDFAPIESSTHFPVDPSAEAVDTAPEAVDPAAARAIDSAAAQDVAFDPTSIAPEPPPPAVALWPAETAGTAEAAIVSEATSDLMFHRLNIWKDELFAWFRTLLSAAVYATLIVTFGFQVARVEGQSMAPTLADQDRLIVNKLAYRLGSPRRGDIVMLLYPSDPDKSFVKRVIAEETDTVKIEDGRVYVNNIPLADSYVPAEYRSHDDFPAKIIPDGYYFVMGDHRNNSSDSRHWGEVPKKYITGRVQLRWWPIPHARVFWNQ